MATHKCPICESANIVPESMKEGGRITCAFCNAQLVLALDGAKKVLRCAFCTKDMVECTLDCETRILERKKLGFFDIDLGEGGKS